MACLDFFFFNCVHLSSLLQISSVKNVKGVPGKAIIDAVQSPQKEEFYRFYTIIGVARFMQLCSDDTVPRIARECVIIFILLDFGDVLNVYLWNSLELNAG